jgi:hypothetical protein
MSPTKATKKPTAASGSNERSSERLDERSSERPPGSERAPERRTAARPLTDDATHSSAPPALSSAQDDGSEPKEVRKDKAPSAIQTLAQELIATNDGQAVLRHALALEDDREATANHAARLIQELAELKPELLVPLIERFARLLVSKNKRVVASSSSALAPLSRIAPAKVAKQLPLLTHNWEQTTEEGKDGLVRTFAGLCTASVAYQKRLEPALARALGEAEPKLLIRWTEIVLPALKGEPHARARAVVEERLPNIPRPQAQKVADFLGIKLRPLAR